MKCPICYGRGTALPGQLCGVCGGAGAVPTPPGQPVELVALASRGSELYALDTEGRLWACKFSTVQDPPGWEPWRVFGNPLEPKPPAVTP